MSSVWFQDVRFSWEWPIPSLYDISALWLSPLAQPFFSQPGQHCLDERCCLLSPRIVETLGQIRLQVF
jgi:hypothetical protein